MKLAKPFTEVQCWNSASTMHTHLYRYRLSQHSFPNHFHEHYVIELVVSGTDKFVCNRKTYLANADEIVFINPSEIHTGSTVNDNELFYYSITPTQNKLQEIAAVLEKKLSPDFSFESTVCDHPAMVNKMYSLFQAIESNGINDLQTEIRYFEFMDAITQQQNGQSNTIEKNCKDKRVSQVIDLIRTSFREHVSLQQMAARVNVSPVHLLRIFKSVTGISPYEYLVITRIEHAKKLLCRGYNVQFAALDSGFYDTSHFIRLFKKVTGITPKNFRLYK